MDGPKNMTCMLPRSSEMSPESSKINFACPSEKALRNYNPLDCDLSDGIDPGIIESMIGQMANQNNESLSYVIMFDGKKIKRGTDVDF